MMNFPQNEYRVDFSGTPYPSNPSVGVVLLNTDLTAERDFVHLTQQAGIDIDWYINRIEYLNPLTTANLLAMEGKLEAVAANILPNMHLDAVIFHCTSGSALIGDDKIAAAIDKAKPDAVVMTTASAAVATMKRAHCQKVSVLTPYSASVSAGLTDYFVDHGLSVSDLTYMNIMDDREVARVPASAIIEAAQAAISDDADGLFISCTALRAVELRDEIQAVIKKPVFSSNYCVFQQLLHTFKDREIKGQ